MAISYEWTPEEQREYSLARLFRYIKEYVYPHHPYYRKLFKENSISPGKLNSYDDLRRIPITEKKDVLVDGAAFVLQPRIEDSTYDIEGISRKKKLRYAWKTLTTRYLRDLYGKPRSLEDRVRHTTAGEWLPIHFHAGEETTEDASLFVYTNHDIKKVVPYIAGMMYLFGWEPAMRALNICQAFPNFAFFQMIFAEFTVDRGVATLHACGEGAMPTKRQVRIAGEAPFDMYIATPSCMTDWLKAAIELIEGGEAKKPDPVKFAALVAEPLSGEYRDKLKVQFEKIGSPNVKIIEGYGSTELKAAFFECGERTNMHLNPEFYFWEVLDPETREPVSWGEPGVLTFSHIDWRGTVLLRYWTGNLIGGGVIWEKCSQCGLTMPVLRTYH